MRIDKRLAVPVVVTAVIAGYALPAGSAPAAAAPAVRGIHTSAQVVTLITGDRVAVRTDAQGRQFVVRHAATDRAAYTTVRQGAELYVFPKAALPYLGVSLDTSLFDVSALIRDGNGDRVPVRLSLAAGTAPTAPGVTVTGSPNATTRDGYVAATDAAAFGAALTVQARRDLAAGVPADRRLFGGVGMVRYAGRGPAPVIRPNFPMFTLRVNAVGVDGAPLQHGVLGLINVDDGRKAISIGAVVNGEARASVPAGHYAAVVESIDLDAGGNFVPRVVTRDFEVTAANTITMDVREATTKVGFTLPRPAVQNEVGLVWQRTDAETGVLLSWEATGTGDLFVAPAPAGGVGRTDYVTSGSFSSPAGSADSYGFDLHQPSTHDIPAVQQTRITLDSLATVREAFANDKRQDALIARFTWEPWQFFTSANSPEIPFPLRNTEYVSAMPGQEHQVLVQANIDIESFGSFMTNSRHVLTPGQRLSEEWWRGPIKPGFPVVTAGSTVDPFCLACRSGDVISLSMFPETDSAPDHFGFLDVDSDGVTSTSRLRLRTGDTVVADEQDISGGDFTVPAGPATYTLVYDQTRIAPWFVTAPVSHTEWTFRSDTSATRTVPDNLRCVTDENCSALSLPDTTYHLNGSLLNTMAPGAASMDLTIRRTPGGRPAPLSRVTVSLSFDGGHRFVPAVAVPLGHDRFRVLWVNPRQEGPVTLKVRAADTAGTAIDQTIEGAYVISAGIL